MKGGLRVGVLCGGRSTEHVISVATARSVIAALENAGFTAVPIYLDQTGRWLAGGSLDELVNESQAPDVSGTQPANSAWTVASGDLSNSLHLDVIFPALHGRGGEDGSIQGLLELAGVPFVGAGVLGSAVGLDKAVTKQVLVGAGLRVADHVVFTRSRWDGDQEAIIGLVEDRLGYPCFAKFADSGSSIGTSKVYERAQLVRGINVAARFGRRLLVEKWVDAREIAVGVLGNDDPCTSVCGEVTPHADFYTYDSKYSDEGAELIIPAELPPATAREIREQAIRVYETLDAAGMARVDFFVERTSGVILVNEVNTIPSLTPESMFARLWGASHMPYQDLVCRLVQLALERHQERQRCVTTFRPPRSSCVEA